MTILKPDVPGTVIRFSGSQVPRIEPSAADTVAVPIISDWGPVGSDAPGSDGLQGGVQESQSFQEYTVRYGDSDTPGRTAVAGAFAGQSIPGAPGAGAVLTYRMAGASAARATHTLVDRQGAPQAALRLDGKYVGSRANNFAVTVDTDPSNALRDRLRIYHNGVVQETYVYLQSDVATLVANINARSKLVTATNLEAGPQRLGAVANQTFLAGGDDGATITGADHLAALSALELYSFGVLSPYDATDPAIQATYKSWIQTQDDANRPVRLVLGGLPGETIDDALTRTNTLADPHIVNVGVGTWHDDLLDKDLSTSQLAPRIAGIIAARGEEHAITFAKIGGLHGVGDTAPTADAIEAAVTGGVVTFMHADAADADIRIVKGVTSFTSTTDSGRPLDVFSDIRLVGIMDNYVRNMKLWGDDIVIGDLPVNDDTRALVRGHARQLQDDLLRRGLILPGDDVTVPRPFVVVDDPGDPNLLDAIPYTFGWQFARTANAILGEGQIR